MWLVKPYLLENPNARSLVIRKNGDDLADWIDRATRLYSRYGAVVTGKPAVIRFPSGYKIRTGHLKDDQAYTKYQGQEYQRMVIEELTQIAEEKNYIKLLGSCRSTIKGLDARIFCTTNPGGVGHGWVKERFIDPSIPNTKFVGEDTGRTRIFIPAKIEDNPELQLNDPDYVKYLEGLKHTDIELYKAWRLGDWNTFAGQFFREFSRDIHVVRPFIPRLNIPRVGGLDWGRTDPFCFLGAVVVKIKYSGIDKTNPFDTKVRDYTFNRCYVFQEAYGTEQLPKHWAELINLKCPIENMKWISCDNQIFNKADTDHSTSIAQQFYDYDPRFYGKLLPASKERVGGWENIHNWLSIAPDGLPYLLIGENCNNLIRTLPTLIHDDIKVEDVDESGEDHACFCRHTPILTKRGYIPIIDITTQDKVWTPIGWSKVLAVQNNGKARIHIFHETKVTSNHPYLTQDGFRQLKDLKGTDKLWNVYILKESPIGVTQVLQDFPIKSILSVLSRRLEVFERDYTKQSGNTSKVLFLKSTKFIIKTVIIIETILKILKFTLLPHIIWNIEKLLHLMVNELLKMPENMQYYGTKVQRQKIFINGLQENHGRAKLPLLKFAISVMSNIKRSFQMFPSSVVSTAKCQCLEEDEVYNLKTDAGMFTVNGVLVSNSDSLRYLLKSLQWIDAKLGGVDHGDTGPVSRAEHIRGDKPVVLDAWEEETE